MYRELDKEGRYVDATGDPVDEDYDEQERLLHLKVAEELFRKIMGFIDGEEVKISESQPGQVQDMEQQIQETDVGDSDKGEKDICL